MTNPTRTCAYCDAPLTGRATKRYCDTSCRSKDFRQQQPLEVDEWPEPDERDGFTPYWSSARRSAPQASPTAQDVPERPEQPALAPLRVSLAEQLHHTIERALDKRDLGRLEQRYERCVEQFLAATEEPQSLQQVRALHKQVRTTLTAYASHPHRGEPTHAAPQRLAELYRIQQLVDEAQQELTDKLHNSFLRFGPAQIELPIKKKWRARLKASLLG